MTDDIGPLMKKAVAAFEAMSPVDKALHLADQRRSFVRGQIGRDPGPSVLAEEVRRLRAENAELRQKCADALEPFATDASRWETTSVAKYGDDCELWQMQTPRTGLNIGDLRAAFALRARLLKDQADV